jgi:hypothetical protein
MSRKPIMIQSSERGIALVAALFMTLILSILGSSLMFVARTETLSSLNYKTMSQGRYGAESGVHVAANYLLFTYAPPGAPGDPIAAYDATVRPVTFNGNPVVLSSDPATASNYPVAAVSNAFAAAAQGALNVQDGSVAYRAHATLLSMRQILDAYSGIPTTVQTWEITGIGALPGAGSANVEVSAVVDRQVIPAYRYAAFATFNGCSSLSFAGGATTDSYDSGAPLVGGVPAISESGGNVGSNGNLDEVGNPTTVWGSLSTPRSGVGACTANNVTAATIGGNASVEDGLIELPQPVVFPTPATPNPLPPIGTVTFNGGCPAEAIAASQCTSAGGITTMQPTAGQTSVTLGNVNLTGGAVLRLEAGTYIVNSLKLTGNSSIQVASGPVVFQVAGRMEAIPIDMTGGSVSNGTYDPMQLQFVYAGTNEVRMRGGAQAAALVYAPNASSSLAGGADFYGAIVTGRLTATGGSSIHYDRKLAKGSVVTAGNFTMNQFTWKAF